MQFGSPRAAGPSDGGLGEAGGGPWTPASPFGAEGEGGQGGLGEGSWGEGGTRPEAACGSEAWGLPGHWDVGAEDPEPQLRRGLVLHRGDPGRPRPQRPGPRPRGYHPPAFSGPRGPGPGSSPAPAPPPHCGAATATATATAAAAPAPTARGGGREEPGTTSAPPPRARAARLSAERCAPQLALSPPPPPLPDPLAPRTPSHRWPEEDRCAALPGPAPRSPLGPPPGGLPGPPPRRAEEGREPGGRGGGPGRARLPFSAAAAEPARGPAPAPLPRSLRAAAGADYSGSGSAPSSAPAAGPRLGPGAGAGTARKAGAARPGPLRQRLAGPSPASARRRVAGVRERAPSRALPATVPPARLPSSPPASGPASRAASSGAHYRVAGGVGPARLRALASARCSPPAAALARAPALRSRPARKRRLGGPGAPRRERPGSESRTPQRPDPAQGPGTPPRPLSRPLRRGPAVALTTTTPTLRGAPRYLALPLRWVPASSTGRRDSGPSSPAAGVKCLPPAAHGAPGGLRPAVLPTSTRAHCTLPASALGLGTAAPAHPRRNPHATRHPRQVPPPSGGQSIQQGQGRGAGPIQAVLEARAPLLVEPPLKEAWPPHSPRLFCLYPHQSSPTVYSHSTQRFIFITTL
ncbi:basic proline-rich protein-like [Bos indicus x Bos taurus]|uniref:basic proline-rich protein-like n=1 Tax=Bos indicus x Bos taurus TaxID=30522 RepID=UPI000F7D1D3F|nr:basic proline-rich protein-like [Bos indicus x Bos taurus]